MTRRYFIGLSAGSSFLGVDAALVRADGVGVNLTLGLEHFAHAPYSQELRDLLRRVTTGPTTELRHLGALHRVLGETFALAVRQLFSENRSAARSVLAIGCPGATICHDGAGRYPSSLSLGMAGVLAERTTLTTVSNFGARDLALGGQAAPLTALVDGLLFRHASENRLLVHLGSVATLIWLPAAAGVPGRNMIGFQAAPCTMLLDGLMRLLTNGREPFDAGGKHAVQGQCLDALLERWMRNHHFHQPPPKTLARWEFGADFLNRAVEQAKRIDGNLHDVLCTMTHFAAHAIVHAVQTHFPAAPARILLSGRGVRNGFLWNLLEQKLAPIPLEKTDAYGMPAEARQSVAHAGMAALTLDGVPLSVPAVTGASRGAVLGQLTPGSAENWARCLAWMAHQAVPTPSMAA